VTRRVLHVVPALAARYGGPSTAALGMSRALRRAGVDVLVVATDADGPARLPLPEGVAASYHDVPVTLFRRYGGEGFKWSRGLTPWLAAHVTGFDLVHVHAVFSHASWAACRAARRARVPFVVRPLGTLDAWSLARHRLRKRALFAMGLATDLRAASFMHYTSGGERQSSEAALPWLPAGGVIPLGIDEACFDPGADPVDPPYVLMLSRLDPKKGIDVVIDAFHRLPPTCDAWRLVVAGTGSDAYTARLGAIAAAGRAAARISFPGWMDGADRLRGIRGASLVALASEQENFGLAVVEGLAAGVPAVVTPGVDLAADIASAGAGWTADRTATSLAAVFNEAMGNAVERRQRGVAARAFAERFRWEAVARQLRDLYDRITPAPDSHERGAMAVPVGGGV
jgi:glycosyltransferase involved in cell wall biosynthesis